MEYQGKAAKKVEERRRKKIRCDHGADVVECVVVMTSRKAAFATATASAAAARRSASSAAAACGPMAPNPW